MSTNVDKPLYRSLGTLFSVLGRLAASACRSDVKLIAGVGESPGLPHAVQADGCQADATQTVHCTLPPEHC